MYVHADAGTLVGRLREEIGGVATALLSRDGTVLYADVPGNGWVETFGLLCATAFGAATTANAELGRGPPERIVVSGPDATAVYVAVGRNAVLVAVLPAGADPAFGCERTTVLARALAGG
jgi:predicted regulator of Ras-like GTPase activity (Roadblock/LC7/MglB family)